VLSDGWRGVFYVNVPIGLIALALAAPPASTAGSGSGDSPSRSGRVAAARRWCPQPGAGGERRDDRPWSVVVAVPSARAGARGVRPVGSPHRAPRSTAAARSAAGAHLRLRRPDRAWSTWSQVPVQMSGAVCGALQIAELDRFGAWQRSPGDDLLPGAHRHLARLFGDRLQACWLPPASCRWLFMTIAELMQRRRHRLDPNTTCTTSDMAGSSALHDQVEKRLPSRPVYRRSSTSGPVTTVPGCRRSPLWCPAAQVGPGRFDAQPGVTFSAASGSP
jgi:hypothetical protein